MSRRAFLQAGGLASAGALLERSGLTAFAGPFSAADFEDFPVPADKKLDAGWQRALFARGEPTAYSSRRDELRFIGMPVGGICTGQLYLGGDGRLWHWDVFGADFGSDPAGMTRGLHYAAPLEPSSPIEQGFAVRVKTASGTHVRRLDRTGFDDIEFTGQYPIGRVTYRDEACSVRVSLEAFSPFIPLNPEDSGLPATIMRFVVRNVGKAPVDVDVAGWLENAVCPQIKTPAAGTRRNRLVTASGRTTIACTAEPPSDAPQREPRPDIVFADFESDRYVRWTVEGEAFGDGPFPRDQMPPYHDVSDHEGLRVANSHNTRKTGPDAGAADALRGTLTSEPFVIQRDYVTFLISGGRRPGQACVNLMVDGRIVSTHTGHNTNRMETRYFDVRDLAGKTATLQVVDQAAGPWGHIGVDHVVFTDRRPRGAAFDEQPGHGSMALSLLGPPDGALSCLDAGEKADPESILSRLSDAASGDRTATRPFGAPLIGVLARSLKLAPGAEAAATFVVSWWFPYYRGVRGEWDPLPDVQRVNRRYENRFRSASVVAGYVADRFDDLAGATRRWVETWYDSTLAHWFLERTFVNVSTLATQTCHWFDTGRFYGWEGTYCCAGTCQHVWNYAQSLARVFPSLERVTREMVDYGVAYHDDGALDYRAESARHVAHDGQLGTIIRVYREHCMSPDDAFLKRIWPRVRRSLEYVMAQDADGDGLLEGPQYNTLDATWYGPMAWISSMYLAAVRAGEAMARDMNDGEFAESCRSILETGSRFIVSKLYNGEYFIHRPDPAHPEANRTGDGCHTDQLFGQSLAHQVGLGRVVPAAQTVSALRSMWKYAFTPDVGAYRGTMDEVVKGGRWFAMPGEGGLLMCTFPRGDAAAATGKGREAWAAGYFNECWTGFEYQVASHMIWESVHDPELLEYGLAIVRTAHDRYHAARRNPFNEIECSDHYARAMASHGVFLAACGYRYHGPRGELAFAPRLFADEKSRRFKAAFTAAEGWGAFEQQTTGDELTFTLSLRYGRLRLHELSVILPPNKGVQRVLATRAGLSVDAACAQHRDSLTLAFDDGLELREGDELRIRVEYRAG